MECCNTKLRIINGDPDVLNLEPLMSDEVHFHVTGFVNQQNMRYWTAMDPRELHEQPLRSPKVTVWCAVGTFGVVGPFFFENDNEEAITVNSER